jgi:hypothetical protein
MPLTLNRAAYETLIAEDLEWLLAGEGPAHPHPHRERLHLPHDARAHGGLRWHAAGLSLTPSTSSSWR